jgi:hypothetical protein
MPSSLVDLPGPSGPALQAAGRSGLAAAAAFELTCKAMHSRATYTNLQLEKKITILPTHSGPGWREGWGASQASLYMWT